MSIYLGNTEIGQIYLGETEISKAYLGSTKVYEAGSGPTPPGPTPSYDAEIEYLQSSGTQYINTGIVLQDSDKIVITFSNHTSNFITGKNGSNGAGVYFIYNNIIQWVGRPSGFTINNGNQHTVELSSGLAVVDGTNYTFTGGPLSQIFSSETVLICKAIGDNRLSSCRIYSFDIKDTNGNYRFKGKPVRVGTTGYLYDSVSGDLFGNEGTGDFTLGNDKTT